VTAALSALVVVIFVLVVLGSVLAMAETALSRMNRVRAIALREQGYHNGGLLERLVADPPRALNPIYFAVMCVQNGSAILVAILADHLLGNLGVTLVSVAFTLGYFVVVEAMAKTFGIQHSDRVALALAPMIWLLTRALAFPTRLLIALANLLLPGRGLKQGPFVTEEEIRSMAAVGHEEGVIAEQEKNLINQVFKFGDTVVREVMLPRPDVVAVEVREPLRAVQDLVLKHGFSRIPLYRGDLDHVEGIVYVKDVLKALHQGRADVPLSEIARPAHFVPESKRVAELLREMQLQKFHIALVTDEYGSMCGLVTLEDLLEELVGEITDEFDRQEAQVEPLANGSYRVNGRLSIGAANDLLRTTLPEGDWDTVGGLMLGLLGSIPREGQELSIDRLRLRAEKVMGRRIAKVLITPVPDAVPAVAE
jgi:CBS domain containing-hemolysin-like protein